MGLIRKRCARADCGLPAADGQCQDCHKPFCAQHIAAVDFSGPRRAGARNTSWTRFVCAGCAQAATWTLLASGTGLAHEHLTRPDRGHWWTARSR